MSRRELNIPVASEEVWKDYSQVVLGYISNLKPLLPIVFNLLVNNGIMYPLRGI